MLQIDTIYSADSVEFCPQSPNTLAIGTYQVLPPKETSLPQEDSDHPDPEQEVVKTSRTGRLYLYEIDSHGLNEENIKDPEIMNGRLTKTFELEMEAILDMKWAYASDWDTFLGVVTAKAQIKLMHLNQDSKKLELLQTLQHQDKDLLYLSLDWSNRVSGRTPTLAVSQSDGHLGYYEFDSSGELSQIGDYKAHDFEAWITAFDYWNPSTIYSGGDDMLFKRWDMRSGCSTFTSKRHEAGVCSISSHHLRENILATGSYDEYLRVWDTRNLKQELSSVHLGGGVWRIRWHPEDPSLLLTPCMYNGMHVLQWDTDSALDVKILSSDTTSHSSIVYGADWWWNPKNVQTRQSLVTGTCSFYDHSFVLKAWPL